MQDFTCFLKGVLEDYILPGLFIFLMVLVTLVLFFGCVFWSVKGIQSQTTHEAGTAKVIHHQYQEAYLTIDGSGVPKYNDEVYALVITDNDQKVPVVVPKHIYQDAVKGGYVAYKKTCYKLIIVGCEYEYHE